MLPQKNKSYVSKEYKARNEFKKIKDCDVSELESVVMASCMLVGINTSNIPEGLSMGVITGFMSENIGGYTTKEVLLAFNHVASGKIIIDRDKEHFQTFSSKYLGYVMYKYTDYLSRNNLSVYKFNEELKLSPDEIKEANKKARISLVDFIEENLTSQKFFDFTPYESLYNLLKDYGYIDELSNDIKVKLYNKYRTEYIKNVKNLDIKEKASLKQFLNNNIKNEHYNNIIKVIKVNSYKNWISKNKNLDLKIFTNEIKSKINGNS